MNYKESSKTSMKNLNKAKILIVDDDIRDLRLLVEILEDDYEINVSSNGKDAIKLTGKINFDLMLLDINMPGIDGFEVCEILKDSKPGLPILFLSSNDDAESIIKGFKAGAVDYMAKPFNQIELKARIRTHLDLNFYKRQILELQERVEDYELHKKPRTH